MSRPYVLLLRALEEAGVAYAIAGGMAAVLHGVPRMTFDLDIVIDDSASNLRALVDTLRAQGFEPQLPVPLDDLLDAEQQRAWVEERNLIAFTLTHPVRVMEELDILLAPRCTWQEVAASLVHRHIDGIRVPVIGRALLRRMKLMTGREKDKSDASFLGGDDD